MRKLSFLTITSVFALIIALLALPAGSVFAAYADGTYDVPYEMKEAGNDNTSIADGYFSSPATLTVQDGVQYIQLTVTGKDMIKELTAPSGAVEVVSEGDDTRTVKFRVDGDLSQPVSMEMHIIVPDLYDQTHTARAVFDVSKVPAAGSGSDDGTSGEEASNDTTTPSGEEPVDNPPTGDSTPIAIYVALMVGAIAVFAVYKLRVARN